MCEIHNKYNSFDPPGLHDYIQGQDKKNNPEAYHLVCELEKEMMTYIINKLKEEFGPSRSEWWFKGIPEKTRKKATEEAEGQGEYNHPEKFLYMIDWHDIIYQNFNLFGGTFTFDAKHTEGKNKRLEWLVNINKIRNIVDHPPQGGISDKQLEYLKRIHKELLIRINPQKAQEYNFQKTDTDNDKLLEIESNEKAECPKCGKIAEGKEKIQELFGYREMRDGKTRTQSWCKECRKSN
jgi:hypothetical protein